MTANVVDARTTRMAQLLWGLADWLDGRPHAALERVAPVAEESPVTAAVGALIRAMAYADLGTTRLALLGIDLARTAVIEGTLPLPDPGIGTRVTPVPDIVTVALEGHLLAELRDGATSEELAPGR